MAADMDEREKRMFWIFNGSTVIQAEGQLWRNSDRVWWFPTLGVSAVEGENAFAEKVDAIRAGLAQLEMMQAGIDAKIAALREGLL